MVNGIAGLMAAGSMCDNLRRHKVAQLCGQVLADCFLRRAFNEQRTPYRIDQPTYAPRTVDKKGVLSFRQLSVVHSGACAPGISLTTRPWM
uniref:Uncharacterized protein n=1 Tax=Hydrogenophaga sp. PL2G6 TaxID=503997 RepID=B4Y322_9BURK|nr:hypothetical protein [Hydrogenophaga sp. PL2G6]